MKPLTLENRLAAYSLFSAAFIVLSEQSNAQVIYTDIIPDTVFNAAEEYGEFDIDNNGIFDFIVINSSFTFTTWPYSAMIHREDILVGPLTSQNAVAGTVHTYSIDFGYDIIRYFPYALELGAIISNDLEWQTAGLQIMAILDKVNSHSTPCFECDWYNLTVKETIDHYLGLRFIDAFGKNHYGWMRCDVIDSGRTLIVKDYAYERAIDFPIKAGDTTSIIRTDINDVVNSPVIYAFNDQVFIHLPAETYGWFVNIYNIAGEKIYASEILQSQFTIPMQEAIPGIYMVELKSGDRRVVKNIAIQ